MRNIFLTALVILFACSNATEVPDDLISQDNMVKVMIEVHLLEAKINNLPVEPYDSTQAVYDHYEGILFADLGITSDQYQRSFNYYVDNPNEFEKIYSAVVDSLMEREQKFK